MSVAFSANGKTFASGSTDGRIQLLVWDTTIGEPTREPFIGHDRTVMSVAFAPDGKTLASGSLDRMIRLWHVNTEEIEGKPLVGCGGSVTSIAFAPDDNTLELTSPSETLLWRLENGVPTTAGTLAQQSDQGLPLNPSIRLNSKASEPHEQGWVFIDEKRCFWLLEDFYLENDRSEVEMTIFGTFLVLHHRNIHILDISAFFT